MFYVFVPLDLKSLHCAAFFEFEDSAAATKMLLIDVLKLNTLKITRLKLKSFQRGGQFFPMVIILSQK